MAKDVEKTEVEAQEAKPKSEAKKPAKKPAAKKNAGDSASEKATSKKATAKKPAAKKSDAKKSEKSESKQLAAAPVAELSAEAARGEGEKVLRLHHLRPAPGAKKKKQRVGRGEGSKGKTAGRGTKGTKARYQVPAGFEGGQMPLHMRLPKLRGFKNPFRVEYQVVNLDKLSEVFPNGGIVTIADLVEKGLVRKRCLVKILGTGEITAKIDITVNAWSASAKDKIEQAGGSITAA